MQFLSQHFIGTVAQDRTGGRVPEGDRAVLIHHDNGVLDRIGNGAKRVIAFLLRVPGTTSSERDRGAADCAEDGADKDEAPDSEFGCRRTKRQVAGKGAPVKQERLERRIARPEAQGQSRNRKGDDGAPVHVLPLRHKFNVITKIICKNRALLCSSCFQFVRKCDHSSTRCCEGI